MTCPPILNRRSTGALDGRAVFVTSNRESERCGLETTEIKRTAYEYQEASVWYHWYDAPFTNICNQRHGNRL